MIRLFIFVGPILLVGSLSGDNTDPERKKKQVTGLEGIRKNEPRSCFTFLVSIDQKASHSLSIISMRFFAPTFSKHSSAFPTYSLALSMSPLSLYIRPNS